MGIFDFWYPSCDICKDRIKKPEECTFVGNILYCPKCAEMLPKEEVKEETKKSKNNWNEVVTPHDFSSYIGQEAIKSELRTMLKASEVHGIPVQHVLFSGGFGLGKTTLAKIFADCVGEDWTLQVGMNMNPNDLPYHGLILIDEIHTVKQEEWLLHLMDSGEKIILGTTTTAGSLSGPLRSRFVSLVLEPYTRPELKKMVRGAGKNLDFKCPDFVAEEVANRSKSVARSCLFLFKRIFDRATIDRKKLTRKKLNKWFEEMGVDPDGLDNADRAYLNCLGDKPVGLQYISSITGFDEVTIEETIEPYLLRRGYVVRTPRGRKIGSKKPLEVW